MIGTHVNIRKSPGYQIADKPTSPLASPRTKTHRTKSSDQIDQMDKKDKKRNKKDKKNKDVVPRSKSTSPRSIPLLSASPLRHSGYSSAGLISDSCDSHESQSYESTESTDAEPYQSPIAIIVKWTDNQGYKHKIPHNIWTKQYNATLPDFQNKCAWCQTIYNEETPINCECYSYIYCSLECYGKFTTFVYHDCEVSTSQTPPQNRQTRQRSRREKSPKKKD